jgi:diguanylate cyclase (GGDEF)-like protein
MPNTLHEQVKEFLAATSRSYSYNIFRNIYIWFGILWGLPIPLASSLFQALLVGSRDIHEIIEVVLNTPIQWLFLAHPVVFGILFGILGSVRQQKDDEVNRLIEELKIMSILDPLTGLSNRRYFIRAFQDELARKRRKETPLSLIFLDLDHFKKINDTHGHRMGDEILRITASHLRTHCRPYDSPARWGGEEFIILLPETNEEEAYLFAERIRQNFSAGLTPAIPLNITVSIGVSQYQPGDTLELFVDRADKALYHAKSAGRDRVVRWSSLSLTPHS